MSRSPSKGDHQRLWTDLFAHISRVHSLVTPAAEETSSEVARPGESHPLHCLTEGRVSVGLSSDSRSPYSSYHGQRSSVSDGNKAGRCW